MKRDKIGAYVVNTIAIVALFIGGQLLTSSGMVSRYSTGIVMMVGINVILTASLYLTSGYLGQLALGHAVFMSVGAYGAALFTMYSGLPSGVSFPVALVILLGGFLSYRSYLFGGEVILSNPQMSVAYGAVLCYLIYVTGRQVFSPAPAHPRKES